MNSFIISLANHKGGAGKTASTYALATALEELGNSVLMVDCDPQANLTISTGLEPEELEKTIYNALVSEEELPITEIKDKLHIIPSNIDLSAAEMELANRMSRERVLQNALKNIRSNYDVIIIDTPPIPWLINN